jgi:hypothetical protein
MEGYYTELELNGNEQNITLFEATLTELVLKNASDTTGTSIIGNTIEFEPTKKRMNGTSLKAVFEIDRESMMPLEWFATLTDKFQLHVSYKSTHPNNHRGSIQPLYIRERLNKEAKYENYFVIKGSYNDLNRIQERHLDMNGNWIFNNAAKPNKTFRYTNYIPKGLLFGTEPIYISWEGDVMKGFAITTKRPPYDFYNAIHSEHGVIIDYKGGQYLDGTQRMGTISDNNVPIVLNVPTNTDYMNYVKVYTMPTENSEQIAVFSPHNKMSSTNGFLPGPHIGRHQVYKCSKDIDVSAVITKKFGKPLRVEEGHEMAVFAASTDEDDSETSVSGFTEYYKALLKEARGRYNATQWFFSVWSVDEVTSMLRRNVKPVPYKVYIWPSVFGGHIHCIGDSIIPNITGTFARNTHAEVKPPSSYKGSRYGSKPIQAEVSNFRRIDKNTGMLTPVYKRYEGVLSQETINAAITRDANGKPTSARGIKAPGAVGGKHCGLCGEFDHTAINCICPFCFYINLHTPMYCPTIDPNYRRFADVPKGADPKTWPKCTCEPGGVCQNCLFLCCELGEVHDGVSYCDKHNPRPYHLFYLVFREEQEYYKVHTIAIGNYPEDIDIMAAHINNMMYDDCWAISAHNQQEVLDGIREASRNGIIIPEENKKLIEFDKEIEPGALAELFFEDERAISKTDNLLSRSDEHKLRVKEALLNIEPRIIE